MRKLGSEAGRGQLRGKPLGHVNRPMPPAGASDSDGQIGFAFLLVTRQQWLKQLPQPVEEWLEIRVALDMRGDALVAPGQRPQLGNIIGIIEEAHVEAQIGIAWYSLAIRKRNDENAKTDGHQSKMACQQAF